MWLKIRVKEIHTEDNSVKGENFLSNLKRVEVKTEDSRVYALVVKCEMEVGKAAEVFRKSTIFSREEEMYRNTLNKITKLLRETLGGYYYYYYYYYDL